MANNLIAQHAEAARSGVDTFMPAFSNKQNRYYKMFKFQNINETQQFHRMYQEGDMPLAGVVNEAQDIVPVNFWTGNNKDYYWVKYGLGWKTSDEALTTDQYGVTKRASAKMAKAMEDTKDSTAAGLFNNCTSTAGAYVGPDGVAMISTAHTYNGGTWSNRGVTSSNTDADLSVVTLEQAIQAARYNPVSREGTTSAIMSQWNLFVHPDNEGLARRLVYTMQGRPTTNDNDTNSYITGAIAGVYANPWFTDADAWFLVSANAADNPLRQITHGGAKTKVKEYAENDMWAFFRTEKWLFHYFDARGIWGTVGG